MAVLERFISPRARAKIKDTVVVSTILGGIATAGIGIDNYQEIGNKAEKQLHASGFSEPSRTDLNKANKRIEIFNIDDVNRRPSETQSMMTEEDARRIQDQASDYRIKKRYIENKGLAAETNIGLVVLGGIMVVGGLRKIS